MLRVLALVGVLGPLMASGAELLGHPKLIRVQPICHASEAGLMVHTILDVTYEMSGEDEKLHGKSLRRRSMWTFECRPGNDECSAVVVSLKNADRGEPIRTTDVNAIRGLRIVSKTGKVITLQWGPIRTITIDLASREVRYRESVASTEGRGIGACDA